MRFRRRTPARDLAAVCAAVVVACGSTAQVGGGLVVTQEPGAAAPVDEGLGPPAGATGPPRDRGNRLDVARPGPSSPVAGRNNTDGQVTAPTAPTAPSPTAAPPMEPTSPATVSDDPDPGIRPLAPGTLGVDDERLLLGVESAEGADAANESLGASVSTGDGPAIYAALTDWVNDTGGIAGRRVELVNYDYDPFSSQSLSSQEQAACSTYTQDNEVFAVAVNQRHTDTLLACLDEQGVPLVSTASSRADDGTYLQFPQYIEPSSVSLHAISRVWPAGLAANGYFDPRTPTENVTVGILTYDIPRFHRTVEEALKPALEAIGHPSVREIYVRELQTVSDASALSTASTNATVRFRSEGVTHVLILDNGSGGATLFFTQAAENQGWRPRYGLNTNNGGTAIVEAGAPPAQFEDSVSLGWLPFLDVPPDQREPANRAEQHCEKVLTDAGITIASANERAIAMSQCEQFLFIREAVDATTGPLSNASLVAGGESLGTSHLSPLVGPTRLAPDRHYGVSRYRPTAYVPDCECFHYIGGWQSL